jgi:3'-phosphoadenosine 5'-phosphosulfate sulfotransferase (PAPS reductase)/FAD synthetase
VLNIYNFSGGKDSTAMLVRAIEEGWQVDRIHFADVGEEAEFEEMYEFVDKVERFIGMPITRVKSDKWTFDSIFYSYPVRGKKMDVIRGFPPTVGPICRYRDWLKIQPLQKAERDCGTGNVIYIGIAVDESFRSERAQYINQKNSYRFPLIEWNMTEADCTRYCRDRGLLNPLYDKFRRLGCWQCPKQSLQSFRALYRFYPQKWEKLREYQSNCKYPITPTYDVFQLEERFKAENLQGELNF